MKRQRDFHSVSKANIHFADRSDYRGHSVTPWVGPSGREDLTQMDVARSKRFDEDDEPGPSEVLVTARERRYSSGVLRAGGHIGAGRLLPQDKTMEKAAETGRTPEAL